jgi:hypothetical protein
MQTGLFREFTDELISSMNFNGPDANPLRSMMSREFCSGLVEGIQAHFVR